MLNLLMFSIHRDRHKKEQAEKNGQIALDLDLVGRIKNRTQFVAVDASNKSVDHRKTSI